MKVAANTLIVTISKDVQWQHHSRTWRSVDILPTKIAVAQNNVELSMRAIFSGNCFCGDYSFNFF